MAGGVVSAAYIGTVADLGPRRLECQQNYDRESGDNYETLVSQHHSLRKSLVVEKR